MIFSRFKIENHGNRMVMTKLIANRTLFDDALFFEDYGSLTRTRDNRKMASRLPNSLHPGLQNSLLPLHVKS